MVPKNVVNAYYVKRYYNNTESNANWLKYK